jgi:hypothetical protein
MPVYFVYIRNYTFRALNEKIALHTNMVEYTYNFKYALNTNTHVSEAVFAMLSRIFLLFYLIHSVPSL